MAQSTTPTQFYVGQWGFWGWLETAVKGIGIVIGLLAFVTTLSTSDLTIGGNPELGAVVILALFTLVAVAITFVRIQQKEIIAIVFWIFSFLGHAGMLIALLKVPQDTTLGILFGIAYVAGELIKQRWLVVSGYTEAGQTTAAMTNLSRSLAVIYVLYVVFLVI